MISRTLNTYLFVVQNPEDNEIIETAIKSGKLGYNKLGSNTYLGFFKEDAKSTYQILKQEFDIVGEVHWISLSNSVITK